MLDSHLQIAFGHINCHRLWYIPKIRYNTRNEHDFWVLYLVNQCGQLNCCTCIHQVHRSIVLLDNISVGAWGHWDVLVDCAKNCSTSKVFMIITFALTQQAHHWSVITVPAQLLCWNVLFIHLQTGTSQVIPFILHSVKSYLKPSKCFYITTVTASVHF